MTISLNVLKKYKNDYFVETGSHIGSTIDLSIKVGFKHIRSVELSEKYYKLCKEKYKNNKKVKLYLGASEDLLYDMISDLDGEITFWLDGHYSKGDTALGNTWTPLLKEIENISKHKIKTHTILIDDIRCFGKEAFDYLEKDTIKNKIKKINKNYTFTYEDGHVKNDILVCRVKQ